MRYLRNRMDNITAVLAASELAMNTEMAASKARVELLNQECIAEFGMTLDEVHEEQRADIRKEESRLSSIRKQKEIAQMRADDDHIGLWLIGEE
jgi:hypothetical protein